MLSSIKYLFNPLEISQTFLCNVLYPRTESNLESLFTFKIKKTKFFIAAKINL